MSLAPNRMLARSTLRQRQNGVALAILVWFLAAMSLLVAGIVMQARVDIKLTQLHATRARVEAAADGAIQLALAQLMEPTPEGELPQAALQNQVFSVGNLDVTVNLTPLSGLIDINSAPEELLFMLFSAVDGLDEGTAQELAVNVVEWRSADALAAGVADDPSTEEAGAARGNGTAEQDPGSSNPDGARHARFEAIEDLLLVTGIDRRIYQAVADAVYVSQVGQAGVDWTTAPAAVLRVLGGMDAASAQELVDARLRDQVEGQLAPVAPEGLDLSFQAESQLPAYRVDAEVVLDGTVFHRRRWVDREQAGSDGLPWSFFRTEALRVLSASNDEGLIAGEGVRARS